jgi:hypothetical protein
MKITPQYVDQIACVAYEAHRGLGLSAEEVDIPTFQILPGQIKEHYRRIVRFLIEYPEATAEQLFRFAPPVGYPPDSWDRLTRLKRLPYEIFRGVVAAFRAVDQLTPQKSK